MRRFALGRSHISLWLLSDVRANLPGRQFNPAAVSTVYVNFEPAALTQLRGKAGLRAGRWNVATLEQQHRKRFVRGSGDRRICYLVDIRT